MGDKTKIEWTDATWNPVTGCTKVSQGCKNCYAERVFPRAYKEREFTDVVCHPERLDQPLRWKRRPRKIFVNSMSDLFHEAVPDEFIADVVRIIRLAKWHTFQVLTKRPERMFVPSTPINNLWLGVSVEDQQTAIERIPLLLKTFAAVRFVSYEPALGPVNLRHLDCDGHGSQEFLQINALTGRHSDMGRPVEMLPHLDWVIAGGESGPNARPAHPDWFRSVRDQCQSAGVPFFFKQWGEWAPVPRDDSLPGKPRMVRGGDANVEISGHCEMFNRDDLSVNNEMIGTPMRRVGKNSSGAFLDGREWKEFPHGGDND